MIHGRSVVVMAWMLFVMCVLMGFTAGATAEDPSETEIEFNGTHLITGDTASNVTVVNETAQRETQPEALRELNATLTERMRPITDRMPRLMSEQQAEAFTDRLIVATFSVAAPVMDGAATLGYRYGSPAAVAVVEGIAFVAIVLPVGLIAWPVVREVKR